jgi:hypothetical protein
VLLHLLEAHAGEYRVHVAAPLPSSEHQLLLAQAQAQVLALALVL